MCQTLNQVVSNILKWTKLQWNRCQSPRLMVKELKLGEAWQISQGWRTKKYGDRLSKLGSELAQLTRILVLVWFLLLWHSTGDVYFIRKNGLVNWKFWRFKDMAVSLLTLVKASWQTALCWQVHVWGEEMTWQTESQSREGPGSLFCNKPLTRTNQPPMQTSLIPSECRALDDLNTS